MCRYQLNIDAAGRYSGRIKANNVDGWFHSEIEIHPWLELRTRSPLRRHQNWSEEFATAARLFVTISWKTTFEGNDRAQTKAVRIVQARKGFCLWKRLANDTPIRMPDHSNTRHIHCSVDFSSWMHFICFYSAQRFVVENDFRFDIHRQWLVIRRIFMIQNRQLTPAYGSTTNKIWLIMRLINFTPFDFGMWRIQATALGSNQTRDISDD